MFSICIRFLLFIQQIVFCCCFNVYLFVLFLSRSHFTLYSISHCKLLFVDVSFYAMLCQYPESCVVRLSKISNFNLIMLNKVTFNYHSENLSCLVLIHVNWTLVTLTIKPHVLKLFFSSILFL